MPGRHARPTPAARPARSARTQARHRRPARPARRLVAVSAIAAASVGVASALLTQWSNAPTFAGVLPSANSGAEVATASGSVATTDQVTARPASDTPAQPSVTISASGPSARPAPASGSAAPSAPTSSPVPVPSTLPDSGTMTPHVTASPVAGPDSSSKPAAPAPSTASESSVTPPSAPTPASVDSDASPASPAQAPSSVHPLAGTAAASDTPGRTVIAVGGPAAAAVAKAWPVADTVTVVNATPGTPLPARVLEALDQETASSSVGASDPDAQDGHVEDGSVVVVAALSSSDADASPAEFAQSYRTLVTQHPGVCLLWVDPTNGSAAVPSGMPQAVAVTAALHADPVVVWGSAARENPDGLTLERQDIARDARRTAVRAEKTASTSCAPTSSASRPVQALPMARDMSVRVYNATWRNNLARNTSWLLSERNMNIIAVANDPRGAYIPGVADIRYGDAGKQQAVALALHVPGARLVRDERSDATVDLVLGQGFNGLAPVELVRDLRSAARVTG